MRPQLLARSGAASTIHLQVCEAVVGWWRGRSVSRSVGLSSKVDQVAYALLPLFYHVL
jgi:hypothetical protein